MSIVIRPYTAEWVPQVKAFNARLAGGGVRDFSFYEEPVSDRLPDAEGHRIFEKFFLAVEDNAVRGGYVLKHQEFSLFGSARAVGYYRLPLSEGLVDRRYPTVGPQMLRTALKCQPLMYCLGMGSADRPLPRMLKAMNWSMWPVPFHFKVLSPGRFLREMRALRGGALRNLALGAARWSGAGWAAINAAQRWRATRPPAAGTVCAEQFHGFGGWADDLWQRVNGAYALIGARDTHTLNILYPAADERFIRVRVLGGGQALGWAVGLDTQMSGHKYFGDLRVGSVVDCLALPGDAAPVVAAATQALEQRGVDLIISNQAHAGWGRAFRAAGFLSGPSNFLFAASPELSKLLDPLAENRGRIHMTRGDGDGPVHL